MKILLLSTEKFSGAGKAAQKISSALNEFNISCDHKVLFNNESDLNFKNKIKKIIYKFKIKIYSFFGKISGKDINDFQSLSLFPTNLSDEINKSDYDIINLTWVNELLSIEDIGKIKKPIVWTLCDMWPIAGINHYENYKSDAFWKFKNFNKFNFKKLSLDKWIIKRKIKSWNDKITLVSPSKWLLDCAKESVISKNLEIENIPWPINRKVFNKKDKIKMRINHSLPLDKKLILFNSFSGVYSKRKGGDLFLKSLEKINLNFEILIIGNHKDESINQKVNHKIHWIGKIDNDLMLSELINCADLLVLPSRVDNLPQTGLEAQACGLPIVAFDTNGVKDLVDHKVDGYLAKPYEIVSLKEGIEWTLNELNSSKQLIENSLKKSEEKWDSVIIAKKYKSLYEKILKKNECIEN